MMVDKPICLANPLAEESVLSCMINYPESIIPVQAAGVSVEDFGYEQNQVVYKAVTNLYERGLRCDLTITIDEIQRMGMIDSIGGEEVVKAISRASSDPNLASEYAKIIKECSIRRKINNACKDIIEDIYNEADVTKLVQRSENMIFQVADNLNSLDTGHTITELVERRGSRDIDDEFFSYGLGSLNFINKGRKRGSLTIIAGYSSEGKSSISISELINSCVNDRDVALFSLEMTEDQIMNRIISKMSGVSCKKLDEDTLSSVEQKMVDSTLEAMSKWKLRVYTDPSVTPGDIRSLQMRNKHDHIIIDYLQRFDYRDFAEVPRIAKLFKNLALQTKCAIDLLSQLTPAAVYPGQNPFPKPSINNLYGGKATGHEADNILFLWAQREKNEADGGWERTGFGQIVVGKYRDGKADWSFDVRFDNNTVSWSELL